MMRMLSPLRDECLTEEVDKYPAEVLQFSKLMVFPTVRFGIWKMSTEMCLHKLVLLVFDLCTLSFKNQTFSVSVLLEW